VSDSGAKTRKPRSPINALKVLNTLREEKGLRKVSSKPKAPAKKKLTKAEKNAIAQQVWKDLFPSSMSADFVLPSDAEKQVTAEYTKRVKAVEGTPTVYTGKPRGRKPKAAQ
jgi:hypothetical protein